MKRLASLSVWLLELGATLVTGAVALVNHWPRASTIAFASGALVLTVALVLRVIVRWHEA